MSNKIKLAVAALFVGSVMASTAAMADCKTQLLALDPAKTKNVTAYTKLNSAAQTASAVATGGYGLPMWVTMVDETGTVCAVTTTPGAQKITGTNASVSNWGLDVTGIQTTNPWSATYTGVKNKTGAIDTNASANGASNVQWLASRVISAQKANTANSLSVNKYAISTANLYAAVQEGGSLYGLQASNPVDASIAYKGTGASMGTKTDGMVNKRPGGINVFGGGLALYKNDIKIGAVGVSGDTSCRDHAFAYQVRSALGAGLGSGTTGITAFNVNTSGAAQTALIGDGGTLKGDEMIFTTGSSSYWEAWAHPMCPNTAKGAWSATAI